MDCVPLTAVATRRYVGRLVGGFAVALLSISMLTACGGGGGENGSLSSFRTGVARYVLPFVGTGGSGETSTLVLANVSNDDATVYVQAFAPNTGGALAGAPYDLPTAIVVPAAGQVRTALSSFAGGGLLGGGWLAVDSRNLMVFDATTGEPVTVATTGSVFPSIERSWTGVTSQRNDVSTGVATRSSGVSVSIVENTASIQVLNDSHDPVPGGPVSPQALALVATFYDTEGVLIATTPVAVPPQGSLTLTPTVTTGHVRIEPDLTGVPATRVISYAAAAREDGFHVHTERRFQGAADTDLPGQSDVGFEVDFGVDLIGNEADFSVLMTNSGDDDQAVVLKAIYANSGNPILTTSRVILLAARETLYLRTTTLDSRGLDAGEESPFADIFGDVSLAQGHVGATLFFQVPRTVDISVRAFDLRFNSYYRRVGAQLRTKNAFVVDMPAQPVIDSSTRTWVQFTNTSTSSIDVPLRVFTPGGTEYVIPTLTVPALSRLDWSPDGTIYREDPTDTTPMPVGRIGILATPLGGLFIRGMTRSTGNLGLTYLESSRAMWPGD